MAEKRRQGRDSSYLDVQREEDIPEDSATEAPLSKAQLARIRLRQRWELASVLNFLHVFRPIIADDLQFSGEEIETALIEPNDVLGRIHIALLKGIPPVNKNLRDPDAWITSVCKKLATWWSWVAEGDNPLKADHGREVLSYKGLDPTTRVLILKALCEVRAEQDDVLRYITDELKEGVKIDIFRKERLGGSNNGITYWYEGDPIIGHRLYREIRKTDSKKKASGKGCLAQPAFDYWWETVATNLEEFREISDSLSSSKVTAEVFVGEIMKTEILPILEGFEKKKKRALKRQQRQVLLLEGYLNSTVGVTRSCRERKPAIYTFDEYDRSIDEAIKMSTKPTKVELRKANGNVDPLNENSSLDEDSESSDVMDDHRKWDIQSEDDDDDHDYDEYSSDVHDDDPTNSGSQMEKVDAHSKPAHKKIHLNEKLVDGLRRSSRNAGDSNQSHFDAYHAVAKKRLRQRPTQNADYTIQIISDSEDDNPAKKTKQSAAELDSSE